MGSTPTIGFFITYYKIIFSNNQVHKTPFRTGLSFRLWGSSVTTVEFRITCPPFAHAHPFLQRSTPMSFHVVALVPNLSLLDFDSSAFICFLSAASFLHCYFKRRAYYSFNLLSLCIALCSFINKSYFS